MPPLFTEKATVEDYLLQKLQEKGWKYITSDDLERETADDPLLAANLIRAIKRLNPYELTESDVSRVLAELKSQPASIEGQKRILRFFKLGIPIKLEKTRELRYIQLFDYDNIDNNEFIVSNQVDYASSKGRIIPDITLFVNGMPLVIIECKNPTDPGVSWEDAYRQIKNYYEERVSEPFKYTQFSVAAEAVAYYFPNVLGQEKITISEWKVEGVADPLDSTVNMLERNTLLDLVRNFIFMREEKGRTSKVIARYMQYEAANRIYERVINNLKGKEDKNSGLIWHWQGSGKTLTMIFSAYKLYRQQTLENPTIFFIVDRDELEMQLKDEFSYLDLGVFQAETISSIRELKNVLYYDGGRGKRGVFITLIHKFRPEEMSEFLKDIRSKPEDQTILGRKNVIALIDEGHRSHYGIMAEHMRSVLRNAFFFAFTGTPIAKRGRDTYASFSPPGEKYLHKYFMSDSQKDGFTLPIVFETRLERKVHLKKELLENFLKERGVEEIPETVEKRLKRKLTEINVFLENPRRIALVAQDVAKHFQENIEGKFKAMVVAADRLACVRYKRAMDKLLPSEYSEVIMTYNPRKDKREITDFLDELKKRYNNKTAEEIKEEVVTKFKKEDENPKILIVTDMLLTGFDAPLMQVMYLDKPLKEHRLLQAIARTNRPYRDVKEAGLVLDYVGILKEVNKAIAIYDKADVEEVVKNVDEKKVEFRGLLRKTSQIFQEIDKEKYNRETLFAATKILIQDPEKAKEFETNYKKLRKLVEFVGRNRLSRGDIELFTWLSAVYQFYNRQVRKRDPNESDIEVQKYFHNTLGLIYQSLDIDMIKKDSPILELNEDYLNRVRKAYRTEESQVYDMLFTLHKFVLVDKAQNPVFEPIAEKVNRIVQQWKQKKLTLKETHQQIESLLKETVSLETRQKELGLSPEEYYLLGMLENKVGRLGTLVKEVKSLFTSLKESGKLFPGWNKRSTTLKEVGKEVRKFLLKYKLPKDERDELYEKVIKGFKQL